MDIKEEIKKNIGLVIVLATLFIYIAAKLLVPTFSWLDAIFGIVIFIEMMFFVSLEVVEGTKKHGWKKEVVDTVIGIVVALILWFGAQWLLNTSTPISAVVSCSMLNDLQRGDFVVVQGAEINAPEIKLTQSEFEEMVKGPFIVSYQGRNHTLDHPLSSYCYSHKSEDMCNLYFTTNDEFFEKAGPITYHYTTCRVSYVGTSTTALMRCVDYVEIKGQRISVPNKKNDVIVYTPSPRDVYSAVGDIVHRSVAKIIVGNTTYYLTAGDNNPILDNQVYSEASGAGNYPPSSQQVKGRVIARIPYLGYLKLFLSGFWHSYDQCSWVLERPTQ